MEITSIEKGKRARGRYNIYIDGKFGFSLNEELLADENLKVGQNIDLAGKEKIINDDIKKKALNASFRFLSYRDRSEKEVREKLETKKYDGDIIDETITKLKDLNLLNDNVFAKRWVEERKVGRGKTVLSRELYKLGIANDIAEEAMKELKGEELEIAKELVEKKKSFNGLKDRKEIYTKIGGFLMRRGFSYETVKEIVEDKIKKSS
ncbi:hypothetical protein COY62_00125 [bacterium (Candidatus Howlettbacteria) CG_4_10_14_0_8_um_filter_40_9]|nr:MAG: hypothetical protein COY62_00125 [bacterium (Candidatus Howlettbacteria) CG_4_10_14_0_8_um_filter_40_9]